MKRTLTALTAALFASAIAMPVLAQDSSYSDTRESTHTQDYQAAQPAPAPNTVERTERTYHSERTSEVAAPVQPDEVHVERKVTTRTETEAVPPPPVNQTTTTTTTHRTTTGY